MSEVTIWKDVKNFEGIYQVSNTGMVRTVSRTYISKIGRLHSVIGKVRILYVSNIGYELITLYKNGVGLTHKIHRMVATAFLNNPNNLPQVNHMDGNKQNNNVGNLEWCSAYDNIAHAERTGLRHSKGEGNSFYNKKHTKETRQLLSELKGTLILDTHTGIYYNSIKDAAETHGIKPVTMIARIKRYKTEKRFITV